MFTGRLSHSHSLRIYQSLFKERLTELTWNTVLRLYGDFVSRGNLSLLSGMTALNSPNPIALLYTAGPAPLKPPLMAHATPPLDAEQCGVFSRLSAHSVNALRAARSDRPTPGLVPDFLRC